MAGFVFPKPRDWNQLEDMVTDVYSREIGDQNIVRFTRYGRQGQTQHGVDSTGFSGNRLIGLQCKNHPAGNISYSEIKNEIKEAEEFSPKLSEYIIVTSADNDEKLQSKVIALSKERRRAKKFPVDLVFWEGLCDLVLKYPDLTYKYFTRHFPVTQLEHITLPGLHTPNRTTMSVSLDKSLRNRFTEIEAIAKERGAAIDQESPYQYSGRFTTSLFNRFVSQHLEALVKEKMPRHRSDQYHLSVGFTTFSNVTHRDVVDLDLNHSHLLENRDPIHSVNESAAALADFKSIISPGIFSRELTVYLQARLIYAFLFGWMFRKVTKFDLNLVASGQVWTTKDMPHVPPGIKQSLPEITKHRSKEVVLILNFTPRSITRSVKDFLKRGKLNYQILLDYELQGPVTSAAHALSIAQAVALNIKNISDQWDASKIYLFMAAPAPLATLIAYHLNGIKPIHLYFYNEARTGYELGGIITNNT